MFYEPEVIESILRDESMEIHAHGEGRSIVRFSNGNVSHFFREYSDGEWMYKGWSSPLYGVGFEREMIPANAEESEVLINAHSHAHRIGSFYR